MFRIGDNVLWHRVVGNNFRTRQKLPARVIKIGRAKVTIQVEIGEIQKTVPVSYYNLERIKAGA